MGKKKYIDEIKRLFIQSPVVDYGSIKRIIKNKTRCIFISPHLDDAILSAGGLISYLSGKVPIEVINVFTNASRPITLSGRAIIKKSGFKDLESFYSARRQEDDKVLTRLDIKKTNLKLVDALFRKKILGKKRNIELLGKIFPEVLHIYPTYRLHVISGYISKQDVGTVKIIKKRFRQTEKGKAELRRRYLKHRQAFGRIQPSTVLDHGVCGRKFGFR